MRPTTDLLQLIRFQVSIYHNAKVCGNWALDEHAEGQTCFHLVTDGRCRLRLPEQPDMTLETGDLLLFPAEIPHQLLSSGHQQGEHRHVPYGDAGDLPGTGLLCAEVLFRHRASAHLLEALPEMLLIRQYETDWLQPLTSLIIRQSVEEGPVSDSLVDRLCELLFSFALSHYLNQQPQQAGLLSLYGHPRISRALKALHEAPDREWTLEALAARAAQSRTSFATTFKQLSGWTPAQYLAWWRMQLAWQMLQSGDAVTDTAAQVGYRSQALTTMCFF
ncbi:MAG: cupin domain-containing protein [Pseudomonadota bacterium]